MIKTFHIFFVLTFTGLFIANYYYLACSFRQDSMTLIRYSLRFSFLCDIFLGTALLAIPISCVCLIGSLGLDYKLPWLVSAYYLCGFVTLSWASLLLIKVRYFQALSSSLQLSKEKTILFHSLNILVIMSLLLTVHDAVMQKTLF